MSTVNWTYELNGVRARQEFSRFCDAMNAAADAAVASYKIEGIKIEIIPVRYSVSSFSMFLS